MKIRIMKIEDFDEMYALWKKAGGLSVANLKLEKEYTEQIIKLNPSSNFVAVEGEKIIGTVFGAFNGKRGWVYHLAVHPKFQKAGLGSKLMEKVEYALKQVGAKRILLGVVKTNIQVLAFYKKNGYTKVDDAIWMGKDI